MYLLGVSACMKSIIVIGCLAAVSSVVSQEEVCPPWFVYNSNITRYGGLQQYSHCVCGANLPFEIQCNIENYTSSLLSGNCAFWSSKTARTVVGHCPYVFPEHRLLGRIIKLPRNVQELNSFLCGSLNRETDGAICGRCANGTGPSVSSFGSQCAQCSPVNALYYVLLHYLPATIIFLFIVIAQVDITSTPFAYFILYSNAWVVYLHTPDGFSTYLGFTGQHYKYTLRVVFILHSIWSFDPLYFISPPLCISSQLEDIDIQYIEMAKTLYPFLLLFLTYVAIELHARDFKPVVMLWRPIYQRLIRMRRNWNPHVSLVQSFATVFLISYMKLICLVTTPFNLTNFVDDHGKYVENSKALYIDPSIQKGQPKHLCLIIISLVILFLIIMPPIMLLLLYPTRLFKWIQDCLSPRVNLALKIFVSTYQGCYKDGTNGTRDYRSIPAIILGAFIFLMATQYSLSSLAIFGNERPLIIWHINIILFAFSTGVFAVLRPHKNKVANNVGICLSVILCIGATLHIFVATYFTVNILVIFLAVSFLAIPHFVFYGYLLYQACLKCQLRRAIRKCCQVVHTRELEQQAILNH